MPRCPACESTRVVVVIGVDRLAFCTSCSFRWSTDDHVPGSAKTIDHPAIWTKRSAYPRG
jgi:transposase-like protein